MTHPNALPCRIVESPVGGFLLWCEAHRARRPFTSVHAAKAACWQQHAHIPVRVYSGDEQPFNQFEPLHATLAIIEAWHSATSEVVAVGTHHYLIRRSRFGIEVPINYKVVDGRVFARGDSQPLQQRS
jgi:hypothetical protein